MYSFEGKSFSPHNPGVKIHFGQRVYWLTSHKEDLLYLTYGNSSLFAGMVAAMYNTLFCLLFFVSFTDGEFTFHKCDFIFDHHVFI